MANTKHSRRDADTMYSLTPRIIPHESSSGNIPARVEIPSLSTASAQDNVAPVDIMATAITRSKSSNMLGKLLSMARSSKSSDDHPPIEIYNSSWPDFQPLPSPMDDAKINPVIRPKGQKLVARVEPRLIRGAKKPFDPPPAPLARPSQALLRTSTQPVSLDQREPYHGGAQYSEARNVNTDRQQDALFSGNVFQSRIRGNSRSTKSTSKRCTIMEVHHCRRLGFTMENQIEIVARDFAAGIEEAYSWWLWYLGSYAKVSKIFD